MINRYKEWEIGQKRMNCTEKCAELSVKLCWKCAIWDSNAGAIVRPARPFPDIRKNSNRVKPISNSGRSTGFIYFASSSQTQC